MCLAAKTARVSVSFCLEHFNFRQLFKHFWASQKVKDDAKTCRTMTRTVVKHLNPSEMFSFIPAGLRQQLAGQGLIASGGKVNGGSYWW